MPDFRAKIFVDGKVLAELVITCVSDEKQARHLLNEATIITITAINRKSTSGIYCPLKENN
jgi:hypothetical protein